MQSISNNMKNKLQKNITLNLPATISSLKVRRSCMTPSNSLKQEKSDNGLGIAFEGVVSPCRTTASDTCGTGIHDFLCKETVVHIECELLQKLLIMMHQLGQQASTCLSFSSLPSNISDPF